MTNPFRSCAALVLGAGSLLPGAAHGAEATWPPPDARVIDGVVAVINAEPVTRFELRRAAAPFAAKLVESDEEDLAGALRKLRADVLESLVEDILILDEARKLKIPVAPDQVEAQIERVKQGNSWSDEVLEQAVRQSGFTSLAAYRQHVERELIKAQAVSIRVASRVQIDPAEVDEIYAKEFGSGSSIGERRALHILIRLGEYATPAEVEEARQKLERIRVQITSGQASFEDMARRHSEDRNAAAGGDLGWFAKGDLDPEFEAAAFALAEGEVSFPARTAYGYHLIKIVDMRTKGLATAEERENILRQIGYRLRERELERLYKQWVRSLRAQAFVEIKDVSGLF